MGKGAGGWAGNGGEGGGVKGNAMVKKGGGICM